MRTLLLCALTVFAATVAAAQNACTPTAEADVIRNVRAAQASALAVEALDIDSGVPDKVAPILIHLKKQLAFAADVAITCGPAQATVAQMQTRLEELLHQAAPGMSLPKPLAHDADVDNKPRKGLFGNNVTATVKALAGTQLLEVDLASSEVCGDDTQILVYEQTNGRWQRALRWSSQFTGDKDAGHSWGDFIVTKAMTPDPTHPEEWRIIFAHGTPWCSSRFSSFGLAVLAPDMKTGEARVVWQTERDYSRGDYESRLSISGDIFEFRTNEDAMEFDSDSGYERTVIYRYRVSATGVTRLEPIATNGRGFVEEWLSMPWQEALEQSSSSSADALQRMHKLYGHSYKGNANEYTSWAAGPVRSCKARGHFQVAFDEQRSIIVPGKPGGDQGPEVPYYFQIVQVDNGYQMVSVSRVADPSCSGPDLMKKSK